MKKMLIAAALMLAATSASALEAPKNDDRFTLSVSRADLGVIGAGISKMPYETAAPLMNALQLQITAQDQARGVVEKPPEPKPTDK